jgi:hypothetical protein
MKTMSMIVAAGLSVGVASMAMAQEKVDLTPKLKAGDVMKFKHHVVRTETKIIGNIPVRAEDKKAEDAAKGDAPKSDSPKADAPKGDAPKAEPAKADAPKAEPAKADAPADGKDAAKPSAPGQDKTMMRQSWTIDQTAVYELRVIGASEAGATLELELKSIEASADLPAGKQTWKNDQPEDDKDQSNAVLQAYKPIVGGILKITMDGQGKVVDVAGDPRIRVEVGGTLAPMVQVMVGPDLVKARWGPTVWIKDGREAATVGQSWKNTEEVPNRALGNFVYETTNTLKSVKDGIAEIEITGDIKLVPKADGKSAQATLTEHSISGSAKWDVKAGMVKSVTTIEKTHLDVNAMGIPVARDLDSTTTITRE